MENLPDPLEEPHREEHPRVCFNHGEEYVKKECK